MRGKISKRTVDALRQGQSLADTEVRGFIARRLPSGAVSYGLRYRDKTSGARRWLALGLHGAITPDQARTLAKRHAGSVAGGHDPASERKAERAKAERAAAETVDALLDEFLERHVRSRLRSAAAIERAFAIHVRPKLGELSIYALRRSHIAALLDTVEDRGGPSMADKVLSILRQAFNWQAARDDTFTPPVVRGMARTRAKDRARSRVLDDDEIRDLWRALDGAEVSAAYRRVVRTLLLTGQRRGEVADTPWPEIRDGVWTIPAARYKTKRDHVVPLTRAVLELLGEPRAEGFVFSTDGGHHPIAGFGKPKASLDRALAALRAAAGRDAMPAWRLHDLRRTARSLMSRAGVRPDIAERVLGHAIAGVEGVYDRHGYAAEKLDALERLAALVARILETQANVVTLERRA
jgi:integrase